MIELNWESFGANVCFVSLILCRHIFESEIKRISLDDMDSLNFMNEFDGRSVGIAQPQIEIF